MSPKSQIQIFDWGCHNNHMGFKGEFKGDLKGDLKEDFKKGLKKWFKRALFYYIIQDKSPFFPWFGIFIGL